VERDAHHISTQRLTRFHAHAEQSVAPHEDTLRQGRARPDGCVAMLGILLAVRIRDREIGNEIALAIGLGLAAGKYEGGEYRLVAYGTRGTR